MNLCIKIELPKNEGLVETNILGLEDNVNIFTENKENKHWKLDNIKYLHKIHNNSTRVSSEIPLGAYLN